MLEDVWLNNCLCSPANVNMTIILVTSFLFQVINDVFNWTKLRMNVHETCRSSSISGTPVLNEPHPSPSHGTKESSLGADSDYVLHASKSQVQFTEHPMPRRASQPNNSPASTLSPMRMKQWGSSIQQPTNLLTRLYYRPETSDVLRMIRPTQTAPELTSVKNENVPAVSIWNVDIWDEHVVLDSCVFAHVSVCFVCMSLDVIIVSVMQRWYCMAEWRTWAVTYFEIIYIQWKLWLIIICKPLWFHF